MWTEHPSEAKNAGMRSSSAGEEAKHTQKSMQALIEIPTESATREFIPAAHTCPLMNTRLPVWTHGT